MQIEFIDNDSIDTCSLFFLGFGMTPNVFAPIEKALSRTTDAIVYFSSYHQIQHYRIPNAKHYRLLAWSFGVSVAIEFCQQFSKTIRSITFCNGTPTPIDRLYGIHPAIVQKMHRQFSLARYQDFLSLCVTPDKTSWEDPLPNRSISDCKEELAFFLERKNRRVLESWPTHQPNPRIWVGIHDRVLLANAQKRAWSHYGFATQRIPTGHMPKTYFTQWMQNR